MKTLWYIQENLSQDYKTLFPVLEKLKIPYKKFNITPFSDSIPSIEHDGFVIVRGSTTTLINAKKLDLNPGVWHNEKFCSSYYDEQLGAGYINNDGDLYDLWQLDSLNYWEDYNQLFVKSNSDMKEFSGMLITNKEAGDFVELVKQGGYPFDEQLEIWVAPPKNNFEEESRFVVVNGDIVSGVVYKRGDNSINQVIAPSLFPLVEDFLIDLGVDVYCMDVVSLGVSGGFKVLEYGCFNSCGLYGDYENIVKLITNFVEMKG